MTDVQCLEKKARDFAHFPINWPFLIEVFEPKYPCYTTGQIRGARGSRPFKLVNEIMSLTKVGIYALGVTKIH